MKSVDGAAERPESCRRTSRAVTVACAAAIVLSAACGRDNRDDAVAEAPTTTERRSTASSTTPSDADLEKLLIDRYLAFWESRQLANQAPPNPDHPSLSEYATGAQLENVISETSRRRDDGLAIRTPDNSLSRHEVRVVESSDAEATLQDCSVNDGVIYRVATGEVVNDDVVTQSIRATMRLVDGQWKLERATLVQEWPGVAGCALAD